jgi:hypothetical protein
MEQLMSNNSIMPSGVPLKKEVAWVYGNGMPGNSTEVHNKASLATAIVFEYRKESAG